MTESDEKIKDFPQKKINWKKKINKELEKILDHPLFVWYQLFSIKNPGIKANLMNPSVESTGKKENLWDGNK